MRIYGCCDCGVNSPGDRWAEHSRQMAIDEQETRGGGVYPDDWSMETADPGDTVWCPECGYEQERSEVIEDDYNVYDGMEDMEGE